MKKILIIVLLLLILVFSYSADLTSDIKINKNRISDVSGYEIFLFQNIGQDIVVNILQSDVNISGILINVYKDGIIVKSFFTDIYIPKTAIAYIKSKPNIPKK